MVIGHVPAMSLADARERAHALGRTLDQGIDPRRAKPLGRREKVDIGAKKRSPSESQHSVEHLVREFTRRYLRPHRKRPEYAEAILARDVLPEWAHRDARTIEPAEVIELLDKITDRGSPVAANRTAGLLSQLFRFGIHRRIVPSSPVQLLFAPGGKERPRTRTLSDDELRVFLREPKDATRFERLSRVITFLLLTGQRRGELTLARWSDIDLEAKTWTIRDEVSKTGRGHVVPLSGWAVAELKALERESEGSPWVLPGTDRSHSIDPRLLTRGMAKCRRRFKERGIEAFTLHDLRRTCRTGLARLKVPPHIAERVINHAPDTIMGTYDRYEYLEEKRSALDAWAAHLQHLRSALPED
jgi:integrase